MTRLITFLMLGLFCTTPCLAVGSLADITVLDRKTNSVLPVYYKDGRYYVAGEPGHEYSLRLSSQTNERLLAVTSVDGINVITGETASPDQSGYVLDSYATTEVSGWRKSLSRVARFFFTRLKNSYAARTGRPDDVGVIGVALFREKLPEPPPRRCCWPFQSGARDEAADSTMREDRAQRPSSAPELAKSESLGTGHGRSEHSAVRYTDFERAGTRPDEVITIFYDSRKNLLAQGIIPSPTYAHRQYPSPFPGSFVPDP